MRREGNEFQVSKLEVVLREEELIPNLPKVQAFGRSYYTLIPAASNARNAINTIYAASPTAAPIAIPAILNTRRRPADASPSGDGGMTLGPGARSTTAATHHAAAI